MESGRRGNNPGAISNKGEPLKKCDQKEGHAKVLGKIPCKRIIPLAQEGRTKFFSGTKRKQKGTYFNVNFGGAQEPR